MPLDPPLPRADPEHPWLGLQSFDENSSAYFFGREAEQRDLFDRVRHRPLTVLFGQTGLGKTSLLRAGLVPRLRDDGYQPIVLRLSYDDGCPNPPSQLTLALGTALGRQLSVDVPLWLLLHDPHYGVCATAGSEGSPRPVLILDQFEEVFTLGARRPEDEPLLREVLAALVENRPPADLEGRLAKDDALALRLRYDVQPVRLVLSLREDYLHRLERWKIELPAVMENRLELRLLTGRQALQAVVEPGRIRCGTGESIPPPPPPPPPPLVSEVTGQAIVRFVAGVGEEMPLAEIDAVPPLLSLVCAELNKQRLNLRADRIVFDPFFGEPPAVRTFLEALPINPEGQRDPILRTVAIQQLDSLGLDRAAAQASLVRLADKALIWFVGDGTQECIFLSAELLKFAGRTGREILQTFYTNCFTRLTGAAQVWVEEHCLSPEGYRQRLTEDTALAGLQASGLTRSEAAEVLEALIASRLLVADERGGVRSVELTHDILAPIVRESRDQRRKSALRLNVELQADEDRRTTSSTPRRGGSPAARQSLDDRDWKRLLHHIKEGKVIPVLGTGVITFGEEDRPLYEELARILAAGLGLELPLSSPSIDAIALHQESDAWELRRRLWKEFKARSFSPGKTLLRLAEIADFRFFISATPDPLLVQALTRVRGPELIVIDPNDREGPRYWWNSSPDERSLQCAYLVGRFSPVMDWALTSGEAVNHCLRLLQTSNLSLREASFLCLGLDLSPQSHGWLIAAVLRHLGGEHRDRSDSWLDELWRYSRLSPCDAMLLEFDHDHNFESRPFPVAATDFIAELHRHWHARRPPPRVPQGFPSVGSHSKEGHIFISYASQDREAARHIARQLQERGLPIWLDSSSLEAGDSQQERVIEAVNRAALFISLISRTTETTQAAFFHRERNLGASNMMRLSPDHAYYLPIVIDDSRPPFRTEPSGTEGIQSVRAPDGKLSGWDEARIVDLFREKVW